jgi:hypothetical protein
MLKLNTIYLVKKQLLYVLLVLTSSFGLGRLLKCQHIYKNLIASLYNALFVIVMRSHLNSIAFWK